MDAAGPGAGRGSAWRLAVGSLAFAIWAPVSMATLPGAALLATTAGAQRNRITAAILAGVSAALLLGPRAGRLDAVTRAFTMFVAVAFFAVVRLRSASPAFLRPALQAIGIAGVATAVLVPVMWGSDAWGVLAWEAQRTVGFTMRFFVEVRPGLIGLYEPVVRFLTFAAPFTLALKAFVGLALAWRWHRWFMSDALPDEPEPVATQEALVTSTQ